MSQEFAWLPTNRTAILDWYRLAAFELRSYIVDVLEHFILFLIFYALLCLALYVLILRLKVLPFQRDVQNPNRVLFVTAHPDDETMFFGPTVLRFTKQPGCAVYIMVLSTGKNYGMGDVRKQEMYAACKVLGIDEACIIVQNHEKLPDAMDANWPPEIIARMILQQVEAYEIDTLITFDKHGVSRHLNHCSIYYAVAHLSISKMLPKRCQVYVLESVNIVRKYWLLLDIPICYILSRIRYIASSEDRKTLSNAMRMHASQFVWFRRLFIQFSRYQMINTLQRMDAVDIQLDLEVDD